MRGDDRGSSIGFGTPGSSTGTSYNDTWPLGTEGKTTPANLAATGFGVAPVLAGSAVLMLLGGGVLMVNRRRFGD